MIPAFNVVGRFPMESKAFIRTDVARGVEILLWSAPTVEENLAIDENLAAGARQDGRRILRLWWGAPAVVLGCGDKSEIAVNEDACARLGVPILKRVTGGGAVLQGPGVFNYSYTAPDPGQFDIRDAFCRGAGLVISALAGIGVESHFRGISDVAVGDRKISGNAQARKWRAVLLHGTVLVDIDRDLMEAVIRHPAREPDYRGGRAHGEFIVTLRELGNVAARQEIERAFVRAAENAFV